MAVLQHAAEYVEISQLVNWKSRRGGFEPNQACMPMSELGAALFGKRPNWYESNDLYRAVSGLERRGLVNVEWAYTEWPYSRWVTSRGKIKYRDLRKHRLVQISPRYRSSFRCVECGKPEATTSLPQIPKLPNPGPESGM